MRSLESGLCSDLTFDSLLFSADQVLFKAARGKEHCLHFIVPAIKSSQYDLRDRGHDLQLPDYQTLLHKKSFLPRYLFQTV
jgi:hypothetical protein